MANKILITGCAGFIGFHLTRSLIKSKKCIAGIDNLNNYYSIKLKKNRLNELKETANLENINFTFFEEDLENEYAIKKIFRDFKPEFVIHLGAQAGVSYSLESPSSYIGSNIKGFLNILEGCRNFPIKSLLYASSSSVYGGNLKTPFSESDSTDHPISFYAATKKSNELMAHTYSHLFNIPSIGMRFFTVYGPWGRPDMAPMLFTEAILQGKSIKVFNNGDMYRDFTYIDDVVDAIKLLISNPATPDRNFNKSNPNPSSSWAPHRIFNIGNKNPVNIMEFIEIIEDELGIKANKIFTEMRPGDVKKTFADLNEIENWIGYKPKINIKEGMKRFVKWYKSYYGFI